MSYQTEREEFIVRMTREGLDFAAIQTLLRCATTINRLAELACSSEAADRDRVPCPAATVHLSNGRKVLHAPGVVGAGPCLCDLSDGQHTDIPRITLQDYRTEQRAIKAVPAGWTINTQGDPRGWCLRVIPPSYAERNMGRDRGNLESIGVPPAPSRLRW